MALSTSAVALSGFLIQFLILRAKIGGLHGRALAAQIGRISLASLAMAAAVWTSSHLMRQWLDVTQLARIADLAVSLPGRGGVLLSSKALGLTEIDMVLRSFTGPLQRRFQKG